MLNKKHFIDKMPEYKAMFEQLDIPGFYKCMAQYTGTNIQYLNETMIETYICTWATSKQFLFKFLGNQLKVDMPIKYIEEVESEKRIEELATKYPQFYHWLDMFKYIQNNKIAKNDIGYSYREALTNCFPGYQYDGVSLTHFFKSKLNAPDELVTDLGRVWENSEVAANFTISIDPIDIMLSSENPYNWTSCYRLEGNGFSESHADGCLAGVLDSATLITYIWNHEGKFTLYDDYTFKNVRYKKMRMTIATNKYCNAIHFNAIYPGKQSLSKDFRKLLRNTVEDYFAKQLGVESKWTRNAELITCSRKHWEYGYAEYSSSNVWYLSTVPVEEVVNIEPYNETIYCPCGCGEKYYGTEGCSDHGLEYNGYGHINENYQEEQSYCEYIDDYVDCDGDCENCSIYNENHMVCELDTSYDCSESSWEMQDEGYFDPSNSNIVSCGEHCEGCPLYKAHHRENPEAADIAYEESRLRED